MALQVSVLSCYFTAACDISLAKCSKYVDKPPQCIPALTHLNIKCLLRSFGQSLAG